MNKKIIYIRNFIILLLANFLLTGVWAAYSSAESEATISSTDKLPILCYGLKRNTVTYTDSACTKIAGYISNDDLCKITDFCIEDNSVQVQYSGFFKERVTYVKASGFFYNTSFSTSSVKLGKELTVYRRSTGTDEFGTVYADDECILTGNTNGRTQVLYLASDGYQLGWVDGTYINTPGDGNIPDDGTTDSGISDEIIGSIIPGDDISDNKTEIPVATAKPATTSKPVAANAKKKISTTSRLPISCYTLKGRVTTYTTSACTKTSGYIDSADLCKIKAFYKDYGSVKVQYPVPGGMKTAYAKTSGFFFNTSFSTATGKTGKQLIAYRRSSGASTIGTVYASDVCISTGNSNGRTQLIYPVSGGYKLGWVSGKYSFNNTSGTTTSKPQNNNEEKKVSGRLKEMMDGSIYKGAYKLKTTYRGEYYKEQCKGFAKSIHKKLFGYLIGSTKAKPNNYQISISSKSKTIGSTKSMDTKNIKAIFSKARPGDFIQVRRKHSGSHSMIYLSSNNSSVTVYECNIDGKNGIKKASYTFSGFCKTNAGVSVYTAKNYKLN